MCYIISLYAPIHRAIIKTLYDRNNSYTIVKCKISSHLRESRPHALDESTRQVNINSQIDNKHQLAYSTQTTTRFHLFSSMSNEDETPYDLLSLFSFLFFIMPLEKLLPLRADPLPLFPFPPISFVPG